MRTVQDYIRPITYIGSQLTYTYENPAGYEGDDVDVNLQLSVQEWLTIIRALSQHLTGRWYTVFQTKFGGNLSLLAAACFDHYYSLANHGGSCVFYHDVFYPPLLKEIRDPPFALNILGDPAVLLNTNRVAVVGSRRATPFSIGQSFDVAKYLTQLGACVVSGGAIGCDIAAHHGVLATCRASCAAIVVLAGGLHEFYPRSNAPVFFDIVRQGGVVLSERLWSAKARAMDFPVRNRIIAGLCERVLVMQAGLKSGAMLTANRALDYGRDVFVLIHPIGGQAFEGNQKLMLDGALGFDGVENYKQKNFLVIRSAGLDS